MSLIYITGPAGSGKTTTIMELRKRGYEAHDADDELCGWYDASNQKIAYPSGENIDLADWEKSHTFNFSDELTKKLAVASEGKLVFVGGNALGNDLEIADKYFDKVICLETDVDTMIHRIKTRPATYGKDPAVLALLGREFQSTLERYRTCGAVMVDAAKPVTIVANAVIQVAKNVHKKYPPVVVVDENDNEIGFEMLSTVWEQGLYHRIVSVFVEDFDGNMLLQLRGPGVKVYPNCWDQAAGGHVDKGYTYEQTAINETREELGIEIGALKFTELGTHRTSTKGNGRVINQFERAYLVKIARDTKLERQTDEVSKLQWFMPTELKNQTAQNPEKFTPGLVYCLEKYFSSSAL